jgi:hypothetical protein
MFTVELLTDKTDLPPTRTNLIRAITAATRRVDDNYLKTVLFFFAGHGHHTDGQNYLSLIDTAEDLPKHTGYALEELLKDLSGIRQRAKVLVFIDACRVAAGARDSYSPWSHLPRSGLGVLYSTSKGTPSLERDELQHGLFSYHLANGLSGAADLPPHGNADGYVSFQDLVRYVQSAMANTPQEPTWTDIETSGEYLITNSQIAEVTFRDPLLESNIRGHIGLPSGRITSNQLLGIEHLNLWHQEVRDLHGLEHCKNLTNLECTLRTEVRVTAIALSEPSAPSDISPLAALTKLRRLVLPDSFVVDIEPLAGLGQLEELILGDNRIIDLAPLSSLKELRVLGLGSNFSHYRYAKEAQARFDIALLSCLTHLEELARVYRVPGEKGEDGAIFLG